MSSKTYYLRIRGRIDGPFDLFDLQQMAKRGVLSRIHEISEDRVNWQSADNLDLFMDTGTISETVESGAAGIGHEETQSNPVTDKVLHDAMNDSPEIGEQPKPSIASAAATHYTWQANRLSLVGGFSAAVLLLFCVNTPWRKQAEQLIWWWRLFNQPSATWILVFCFYLLLAGLGLCVLTPVLQGRSRGWIYIALTCLGFPLLITAGMPIAGPEPLLLYGPLVSAVSAELLVCLAMLRSWGCPTRSTHLFQATVGGLTCVTVAVVTDMCWQCFLSLNVSVGYCPAWRALVMVLSIFGYLGAFACGILSVIASRVNVKAKLSKPTIILGLVAIVTPAITSPLIIYGNAAWLPGETDETRFVLFQALRLVVLAYTLMGVLWLGLTEVLANISLCQAEESI